MRLRSLALAALAALAAACTFPDVDYADGGASSGAGGSCPGLDPCTAAAASCAAMANGVWTTCTTACHAAMGCTNKCDLDQATALSTCDATCTSCAPPGCSTAAAACKAAAGM
jgi:hypothetical protein